MKTLDELREAWVDASAAYDLATYDYAWSELRDRDCDAVDDAKRAMDVAWDNYDAAFKALLDAVAEAAKIKPCESATTPAQPALGLSRINDEDKTNRSSNCRIAHFV